MTFRIIVLACLLFLMPLIAQDNELSEHISTLENNIYKVQKAKETYKQSISSPASCVLKYTYDIIDRKGGIDS